MIRFFTLVLLLGLATLAMVRIGLETSWRAVPQTETDSQRVDLLLRVAASPLGGGVDRRHLERLAETSPIESERRRWLQQMIDTDPRDADAWVALGLSEESDGLTGEAEDSLLAATRLSKRFEPAWTLANFYFRRQRLDEFWRWLQIAARRAPDGYLPILQLADRCAGGDPDEVMSRLAPGVEGGAAVAAGPDPPDARTRLLWDYLDYLIGQQRFPDAVRVADRILTLQPAGSRTPPAPATEQSTRRIAELTDRMIAAGLGEEAAVLWARLPYAEGWAPASPPPERGAYDFDAEPTQVGFDWKFPDCQGVRVAWQSGELVAQFDGNQPDNCIFLTRVMHVDPTRRYRVKLYGQPGIEAPEIFPRGLRINLRKHRPRG